MGTMGFCPADKAKSELAAGAGTVPGYDFPTSNAVQDPTCTGAEGIFAHAVLWQFKNTNGIRSISSSKAFTQLQE
jgi:hypothetical protein